MLTKPVCSQIPPRRSRSLWTSVTPPGDLHTDPQDLLQLSHMRDCLAMLMCKTDHCSLSGKCHRDSGLKVHVLQHSARFATAENASHSDLFGFLDSTCPVHWKRWGACMECVCVYVCTCVCVTCICVYVYACACMCTYTHLYTWSLFM